MTNDKKISVYTILHSDKIDEKIKNKEYEVEVSHRLSTPIEAFNNWPFDERPEMYLILAPAEGTKYLYAYGRIKEFEIKENHTLVKLYNLKKFTNKKILKTSLVLTKSGNTIDPWFNRDYVIINTDSVIKYIQKNEINKKTVLAESEEDNSELLQLEYHEGSKKTVSVNKYERNPKAKQKCIEHYGAVCTICGFDFEKVYGERGKGFIHVHHLIPVSKIGKDYKVDPIKDLRPVCSNCHTMIHRYKPELTIEEMKELLKR